MKKIIDFMEAHPAEDNLEAYCMIGIILILLAEVWTKCIEVFG